MCCFVWSDGDGRGAGTFDASAVALFLFRIVPLLLCARLLVRVGSRGSARRDNARLSRICSSEHHNVSTTIL